jgi:GT2 family glycosyltransferase
MYVGHLLVVRRTLLDRVGGFDPSFDKIQDFELMMRLCEQTERIHHIPEILYHWRAIPGSIAAGAEQKSGVPELQARAVSEHLERIGARARAVPHPLIPHRAQLAPVAGAAPEPARVSAVIGWRGEPQPLRRLLASLERLDPPALAAIVVVAPSGAQLPADLGKDVIVVEDPGPGVNPARAANLGARAASGEELLFLADTVELVEPDSLQQLLLHRSLPGVAAAGPLHVRPDGRTHAAGIAVGLRAPALPMLSGLDADADGYYGALVCAREVSALSAECLLVSAAAFERAGGFSEWYASEFHDYDLCQRLLELGERVVYTPRPRVVTHELPQVRRQREDVIDRALFVDSWYERLERGDPYFNPNFSREHAGYAISD